MTEKPRKTSLKKGAKVEVCPFPTEHKVTYGSLGKFDGREGTVVGVSGHGEHIKVMVRFEGDLGALEFPIKALKPSKAPKGG